MKDSFRTRLKNAYNAFNNKDPTPFSYSIETSSYRPYKNYLKRGIEKTIVNSIYNRIAVDVCSTNIRHIKLDENGRFLEEIDSGLNSCLKLEANIDQNSLMFMYDVVLSMLNEGIVAVVPIDTDGDPNIDENYEIETMRTGKILEWKPNHIKVEIYNDRTGKYESIWVKKRNAAIIENPFYSIMNEPNSTMQRLIRKLSLLDITDEDINSGKFNLIVQLPYVVRSELKQKQAEKRRNDIENQLTGSKYGIAYIDGTEKVTQLNRSIDNNLLNQVESLTNRFYTQTGMSQSILDGTANEETILNYNNRIVEPILSTIVLEFKRKFLTKEKIEENESIEFFRDPFKLVPLNNIAEIVDKFTRNEILTSNEVRQIIGMKPSKDPRADELRNKNLSEPKENINNYLEEKK